MYVCMFVCTDVDVSVYILINSSEYFLFTLLGDFN